MDSPGGMSNGSSSTPVLTNVTISGNYAPSSSRSGMYNYDRSSPTIRNSIIWGNNGNGSTVYNVNSVPIISYSIVQGSGGSGSWNTYCGADGGNNLDEDPLFVNRINPAVFGWTATTGGDYHVGTGSPAINAGSDTLYPANADAVTSGLSAAAKAAINAALPYDLDGSPNARKNGAIDMGAYEKQ